MPNIFQKLVFAFSLSTLLSCGDQRVESNHKLAEKLKEAELLDAPYEETSPLNENQKDFLVLLDNETLNSYIPKEKKQEITTKIPEVKEDSIDKLRHALEYLIQGTEKESFSTEQTQEMLDMVIAALTAGGDEERLYELVALFQKINTAEEEQVDGIAEENTAQEPPEPEVVGVSNETTSQDIALTEQKTESQKNLKREAIAAPENDEDTQKTKLESIETELIRKTQVQEESKTEISSISENKNQFKTDSSDEKQATLKAEIIATQDEEAEKKQVENKKGEILVDKKPQKKVVLDGCYITLKTCPKFPEKMKNTFKDEAPWANKKAKNCLRRASWHLNHCGADINTGFATASFFEKGHLKESRRTSITETACVIETDACQKHPHKVGRFFDDAGRSSINQVKCLARAANFMNWCGADYEKSPVTAKFYSDGKAKAETTIGIKSSVCVIKQNQCVSRPHKAGVFVDNHKSSSSDEERCLKRAGDFARMCKNTPDISTTAEYFERGVKKASRSVGKQFTGCYITIDFCPRNPKIEGTFFDNAAKAYTSSEQCSARATHYARRCQISPRQSVKADFYQNGEFVSSRTVGKDGSACFIKQDICQAHTTRVGEFFDDRKGSSSDPEKCLERALRVAKWCRNPLDEKTTATYYQDGKKVAKKTVTLTDEACVIQQDTCLRHPKRVGTFIDNYKNASTDRKLCLKRALAHAVRCQNPPSATTTATFYKNTQKVATEVASIQESACIITQKSCANHPRKVGSFFDNRKNSSKDKERCLRRAHDFASWCGNKPEVTTTAEFYDNGRVVDKSTAGLESESVCVISMDTCRKHPKRAGMFIDNHHRSSQNEARCMKRAGHFSRWCGNKPADTVKSFFYKNGELESQNTVGIEVSACVISMDTCLKHPTDTGSFIDNHKDASQNQERCMKRAFDYAKWCGNTEKQNVKAEFYQQGEVVATQNAGYEGTSCVIELKTCQKRPKRVGTFIDNRKNASSDEAACLKRAQDYTFWCRNGVDAITTATYWEKGEAQATATNLKQACVIQQEVCRKHPSRVGTFFASHKKVHGDVEKCLRRAKRNAKRCDNNPEDVSRALFYKDGSVIASEEYSGVAQAD